MKKINKIINEIDKEAKQPKRGEGEEGEGVGSLKI